MLKHAKMYGVGLNDSENKPYKQLSLEKRLELMIINISLFALINTVSKSCLGFMCCVVVS